MDAGSGPIPHDEYLTFHQGYKKRLCVDFSLDALYKAKKKLGDKGIYVVGDLTELPLQDGVAADAVAMHVIYHIPEEKQARALDELHRVLQPGRKAVIVYSWPYAPLVPQIERICRLLAKITGQSPQVEKLGTDQSTSEAPKLYFYAHDLQWFRSIDWSFKYRVLPFRIIGNPTMKKYFTEHWIWTMVVKALEIWQKVMPGFTGRYGAYPVIVIEKRQG